MSYQDVIRQRLLPHLQHDELLALIRPRVLDLAQGQVESYQSRRDDAFAWATSNTHDIVATVWQPRGWEDVKERVLHQLAHDWDRGRALEFFRAKCSDVSVDTMIEHAPRLEPMARERADTKQALVPRVPDAFVRGTLSFLTFPELRARGSVLNRAWCDRMHFDAVAYVPEVKINFSTQRDHIQVAEALQTTTSRLQLTELFVGEQFPMVHTDFLKSMPLMTSLTKITIGDSTLPDLDTFRKMLEACPRPLDTLALFGEDGIDYELVRTVVSSSRLAPRVFVYNIRNRWLSSANDHVLGTSLLDTARNAVCQVLHFHYVCRRAFQSDVKTQSQLCRAFVERAVQTPRPLKDVIVTLDCATSNADASSGEDEDDVYDCDYGYGFTTKASSGLRVTFSQDQCWYPDDSIGLNN